MTLPARRDLRWHARRGLEKNKTRLMADNDEF